MKIESITERKQEIIKISKDEKINFINDFIEYFKNKYNKKYELNLFYYFYLNDDLSITINHYYDKINYDLKSKNGNTINKNFNFILCFLNIEVKQFKYYFLNKKLENKLIKKNVATKTIKI